MMMPSGAEMFLIENAIRQIGSTMCLDPDRSRRELAALAESMGFKADRLGATEMELMRLSNVSDQRFLTDFVNAGFRLFASDFRRSWIPSALRFVQLERELFGTAPAAAPMQPPTFRCLAPIRIVLALSDIEDRIRRMDAIFNQLEPAFQMGAQVIEMIRGPMITSPPPGDPGRGSRPLSTAEQVAFATVGALREELMAARGVVEGALREFTLNFAPAVMFRPGSVGTMSV